MADIKNNFDNTFVDAKDLYNKKAVAVPKESPQIGIDVDNNVLKNIVDSQLGTTGGLDIGAIESFTSVSQSRDQVYNLIDTMCQDSKVAAVLETYVEDATETNDKGKIVWCESSNEDVMKYVNYLLDVMNVDKYSFKWVYNLCKYGDLYLHLYRESDYEDDVLASDLEEENAGKSYLTEALEREDYKNLTDAGKGDDLKEDINIVSYQKNDRYTHYMEMVASPAEMFELVRHGKTYAYIKAEAANSQSFLSSNEFPEYQQKYSFRKGDIEIHGPTDYVHASLEGDRGRIPEEVSIFVEDPSNKTKKSSSYVVRRGQSLLYNTFKIWRELKLLEDSVILNRVTKSSIVRIVSVEVGDMDKSEVGPHLQGVKSLIEQKASLNAGNGMGEYTNPGPIENNVYISTRDGKGAINISSVGGDVDVGKLADLDYFQSEFYGSLRVPKQFFGVVDDNGGFSGGQSLAIISSQYAKMVKRIQNCYLQALTDAINLMLLDRHLSNYVNKFTLRMQEPTTQEEIDRRSSMSSKLDTINTTMGMLNDIEDPASRLKALKALISTVYTDGEIVSIIQAEIDKLEGAEKSKDELTSTDESGEDLGAGLDDLGSDLGLTPLDNDMGSSTETGESTEEVPPEGEPEEAASLPSPGEIDNGNIDFSDNTAF